MQQVSLEFAQERNGLKHPLAEVQLQQNRESREGLGTEI
jgi:hypothetical protein